jgi:zinc protease
MLDDIKRIKFSNGLLVLLKEIHTAPLISQWIWYRVGGRDEFPGITGISHWVEHMQFKGTPQFPQGVLEKLIASQGGVWNAFTYLDWTAYFETMPADKIDLALRLEADRMRNTLFEDEIVNAERTVIISERQGAENEPLFRLNEAFHQAAFKAHPYSHDVIGSLEDLTRMDRDDLYKHYRTYYVPNNAVLALAGDFEGERILERLVEIYEPVDSGKEPPRLGIVEPRQTSQRRVVVDGPGETAYIKIGWHIPPATNPDFWALNVLGSLLTGPSSHSIIGGGISNKTSRLYQVIVEGELGVSVSGSLPATIDPHLFEITIVLNKNQDAETAINAVGEVIQQMQESPPTEQNVARAVKQAKALFAYGSESITNQAAWLGFTEMFASYEWFRSYLDNLAKVTTYDVQEMAQKYFTPQNLVLAIYRPTGNMDENE